MTKILLDPGHGLYQDSSTGEWKFQRPEVDDYIEDLMTPYLAKYLEEALFLLGHETVSTRPLPFTPEGILTGPSGRERWQEGSIYWARLCFDGHPYFREEGSNEYKRDVNVRTRLAELWDVQVAISLHSNASEMNPQAHGVEVWQKASHLPSSRLSTLIYNALVEDPRWKDGRGVKGGPGEEDDADNKGFLRRMRTDITPSLVEFLFHTHNGDRKLLGDGNVLRQAASLIAGAVDTFIREEL